MDAILPVNVLREGLPESDGELCQGHPETVDRSGTSTVRDIWSRELCEGTCESLHPSVGGPEIGWIPYPDRHDIWSVGRFVRAVTLPRTTPGSESRIQRAVGNRLVQEMRDWGILLLQYLLQQNRSITGEDKVATGASECKQYCDMPLLTYLTVMMRIDPLALVYGPVMSYVFLDVQVKAYRNSVLYVNLVSVVDCSVLNWVEQKELRGLASDDRLFGKIAEPG